MSICVSGNCPGTESAYGGVIYLRGGTVAEVEIKIRCALAGMLAIVALAGCGSSGAHVSLSGKPTADVVAQQLQWSRCQSTPDAARVAHRGTFTGVFRCDRGIVSTFPAIAARHSWEEMFDAAAEVRATHYGDRFGFDLVCYVKYACSSAQRRLGRTLHESATVR